MDLHSSAPIRWAIIGPGHIAGKFAKDLEVVDDGVLRAVAGRDLGRATGFAAQHGAPLVFDDAEALANEPTVDMVYIATPHPAHFAAARRMLEAGKPVLCEKPLTVNAAQARELLGLSRERGVFLMEAVWTRFLPIYGQVRKWLDAGRIGSPRLVTSSFCIQADPDPEGRWLNPDLGGGALLDLGVYCLAMSQWALGGKPVDVAAVATPAATGVDDFLSVSMRYASGAHARFSCALSADLDSSMTIQGDRGGIRLASRFIHPPEAVLETADGVETASESLRAGGFEYEIEEAMRCFRAGLIESPMMPHADTLATMEVMDAIRQQIGLRYPGEAD